MNDETRKPIDERIAEGAERMIETGKLPSWMEAQTFDTAKVILGPRDGEYVVVCSPPKSAASKFRSLQSQFTRLAGKAKDGQDVSGELEKLADALDAAEAEYLSAAIIEVGDGVKFRAEVGKFKVGDKIPAPRDVSDEALRRRVISEALPEFVCRRVYDATGFLAAQGLGALLGNG